jgi:hypothetical protein
LESSNGNGSGVVTDGILDCDFSEMEKFFWLAAGTVLNLCMQAYYCYI